MSQSKAQQDYTELCGTIHTPAIAEALERARVVGVLDAWAARQDNSGQVTVYNSEGLHWCCGLHGRASRGYTGKTPDEARAAAAKAIESGEV